MIIFGYLIIMVGFWLWSSYATGIDILSKKHLYKWYIEDNRDEFNFWIFVGIALVIAGLLLIIIGLYNGFKECENNTEKSDENSFTPQNSVPIQEVTDDTNYWKCPKCGKFNYYYVGSCGCGAERKNIYKTTTEESVANQSEKEDTEHINFCTNCGAKVTGGANFCKNCGKKII